MYYKNAKIYTQDFRFQAGAFSVENGRFAEILPESVPADAVDLQGAYVFPGLVDLTTMATPAGTFPMGITRASRPWLPTWAAVALPLLPPLP